MTTTTSPEGNMTTTTSPEVNMTTTTSPESNTTTTTSPEGNTTTTTSSEGNMTTTTSEGNTTSPEGNTTTTTSPEANTTFPEGNMTTTTSPEGNMTTTSPEGNTTTTASPETNMTTTTSPEGNMTTNVTKTETTAPVLKKFSKSKRNRNREKIRFRRSVREVPFASIADKSKSQRDEYATHNSLDMQRKQRKLIPAKVLYPSKGEPFSLREWNSTQSPVYLADEHLRDLAHILQTLTTDLQDAVREDAGPSEFMTLANDEAQLRTLTATLENSNTVISTEEKDHLSRLTNFTRMSLSMAQEIVQLRLSTIAEAGTMHVILGITVSGCILLVTILVWTCYRHRRAPSNTDSRDNLSSERNFASPATYSLSRPLSQSSVIHSSSRDSSEVPQADYATSATPGGAESGRRADAMPLHHYPSGRPNERPI
nr:cell wall protein DAN4-like [Penaeus vannamei]